MFHFDFGVALERWVVVDFVVAVLALVDRLNLVVLDFAPIARLFFTHGEFLMSMYSLPS